MFLPHLVALLMVQLQSHLHAIVSYHGRPAGADRKGGVRAGRAYGHQEEHVNVENRRHYENISDT